LTFEQNADDVAALLKYLRIEKADFFGESFGGIVAMLIAARHPALVRRVAIYGTALGKFAEVTRPESMTEFAQLTPDTAALSTNAKATSGSPRTRRSGPPCSRNPAEWR
jgi:pimeloyl-ACP methyl ester carboxylesterase